MADAPTPLTRFGSNEAGRPNRSRIGAAGAYFTAAQLAFRGWDASLTVGNAPRTDIVAQHGETQHLIAVQCKAATSAASPVGKNCEVPSPAGRDEWFVFVALGTQVERPAFFVVPRNVVAAYVHIAHRSWLQAPATRSDAPRKDTERRTVEHSAVALYRERWDLLERPAAEAPHLLPQWIFDWAQIVGLPEAHPGLAHPGADAELPEPAGWARKLTLPG